MGTAVTPWEEKAHRIIARVCLESYRAANIKKDGSRRKRHVPYSVPDVARRLVEALGRNDEETAKAIFLFDYDAQ